MAKLTGLTVKRTVRPKAKPVHDTPVHRFVAELKASTGVDYKTTVEVAETLGVSTQWVRKIQQQHLLNVPSKTAWFGRRTVYLYTPQDVSVLRDYLARRQQIFDNTGPNARVQSWEDVIGNRDRTEARDEDSAQRHHEEDDKPATTRTAKSTATGRKLRVAPSPDKR
jgi:hypothetical protein